MNKCGDWFDINNPPKEREEVIILCKNGNMFISSYCSGYSKDEQRWMVKGPLGSPRRIATNRILFWTPKPTPPVDE